MIRASRRRQDQERCREMRNVAQWRLCPWMDQRLAGEGCMMTIAALLVGIVVTVLVFGTLFLAAPFLFTGGGLIVACLVAGGAGTAAASYVRPTWGRNALAMALVAVGLYMFYVDWATSRVTGPEYGQSIPAPTGPSP